jgi:hypothetical protein
MNCLVLASLQTQYLQSEVQELVNVLGHRYKVQLLQTRIDSAELYRALDDKRIELLWVASHSGPEGFIFENSVITPTELGLFLYQAKTNDLILNSCFSVAHIAKIQQTLFINILATIQPAIEDKIAWTNAIYLARELAKTGNLVTAYNNLLSSGQEEYQLFPKKRAKMDIDSEELTNRLARLERMVENILHVQQGHPEYKQRGVVDIIASLEQRMDQLEERMMSGDYLYITRGMLILLTVGFTALVIGIIYLTYVMGGYDNVLSINLFNLYHPLLPPNLHKLPRL